MWAARAARARLLATRYPASAEILAFYARLAEWQGEIASQLAAVESVADCWGSLLELVERFGPPLLSQAARRLDPGNGPALVEQFRSRLGAPLGTLDDFFARAALQPVAAGRSAGLESEEASSQCPRCRHPPQVGCLRQQGEGQALEMVCSLCLERWPFLRLYCPGCGESEPTRLAQFATAEFPHLRIYACESCRGYLAVVDLDVDPEAIPEVDELAGLPLDLWARQQGYWKLYPNLAGV